MKALVIYSSEWCEDYNQNDDVIEVSTIEDILKIPERESRYGDLRGYIIRKGAPAYYPNIEADIIIEVYDDWRE